MEQLYTGESPYKNLKVKLDVSESFLLSNRDRFREWLECYELNGGSDIRKDTFAMQLMGFYQNEITLIYLQFLQIIVDAPNQDYELVLPLLKIVKPILDALDPNAFEVSDSYLLLSCPTFQHGVYAVLLAEDMLNLLDNLKVNLLDTLVFGILSQYAAVFNQAGEGLLKILHESCSLLLRFGAKFMMTPKLINFSQGALNLVVTLPNSTMWDHVLAEHFALLNGMNPLRPFRMMKDIESFELPNISPLVLKSRVTA